MDVEFKNITDALTLFDFITYKQSNHQGKYVHYSSLDGINGILSSHSLWMSNIKDLNDKREKDSFDNDKQNRYFTFCFTGTENESIPLWYLYGDKGKGASIILSKAKLECLIKSAKYLLRSFKNNDKVNYISHKELGLDDIEVHCQDILYYRQTEDDLISLKYRNRKNTEFNIDSFNEFKNSNKGFYKSLIWEYEKEYRILVKLKKDVNEYMTIGDDEKYYICLEFDKNLVDKMIVKIGPEYKVRNVIEKYDQLKKLNETTNNVRLSEHRGTIEISL